MEIYPNSKTATMTPKEKANQMYFYYVRELSPITIEFDILSKKFALNMVDEILDEYNLLCNEYHCREDDPREYWERVKKEIELLTN